MSRLRTWIFCSLAMTAMLCFSVGSTDAQSPSFSSLYTNLKTECRNAIRLKKGEELNGDMPLKCKGYGGYEIRVGYSAMSSQFSINRIGKDEDVVVSTMQPINYDLKRKVEWRFANGKPFAVIYRIDLTKGTTADSDMWSPENKTGESLVIKGLKGFEQIDFEIDAKSADANLKAREMADKAYSKKS